MEQHLAVVTGASGGLGAYICEFICRAGLELVLVDRDPKKSSAFAATLARRFPNLVKESFTVDLADHRDIRRLTNQLLSSFPRINYLFNNAGVLTESLQFSRHHNELHFEVNTLAPLQLIDQLRPALRAASGAIVVNTSAGLSLRAKTLHWDEVLKPTAFQKLYGPYVNSKAALNVVTSALAQEMAADAILLRAADPGPNQTGLTKGKGTPLWIATLLSLSPDSRQGSQGDFRWRVSLRRSVRRPESFSRGEKYSRYPPDCVDPTSREASWRNAGSVPPSSIEGRPTRSDACVPWAEYARRNVFTHSLTCS